MEDNAKRDAKGRFGPGNCANPKGRPKNGESWKDIMVKLGEETGLDGVPLKEKALRVLYSKAMDGDLRALELVLGYMEGRPTQAIKQDVTTGGESLNARVAFKGKVTELPDLSQGDKATS